MDKEDLRKGKRKKTFDKDDFLMRKLPIIVGIVVIIPSLIFCFMCYKALQENHQNYLNERIYGTETTAKIIDKETAYHARSTTHYYISLVGNEGNIFTKKVQKKEFGQVEIGDTIEVVIKDDVLYLGNKQDEEETIHLIPKK